MIYALRFLKRSEWANKIKYNATCFDTLTAPLSRTGQRATGLTPELEKELEILLSYEPGTLSKTNDQFWDRFAIKIPSYGITLNTEIPLDRLHYEFLSHYHRVANGLTGIKPGHDYVLVNEESEAKERNSKSKTLRKALKELDKLTIDDMRRALKLYGLRSETLSNEMIEARLFDNINEDPQSFFDKWVNNNKKETEWLIESAISLGILRKSRSNYYMGTDLIGTSKLDTIAYLEKKENEELKLSIEKEVKEKTFGV